MTKKETKEDTITLEQLVSESKSKIIDNFSVRNCIVKVVGKKVSFDFKPLRKKAFIKAQSTQDEEKIIDIILTNTLWNSAKERFWTVKELNEGIPPAWQILLLSKIMDESGYNVSDLDINF